MGYSYRYLVILIIFGFELLYIIKYYIAWKYRLLLEVIKHLNIIHICIMEIY